jgi:FimV-like protein
MAAGHKTDEALALFKRAAALEPGEPGHKFMLAQAYMRKEDYAAARQLLETVVRSGEPELRAHAQQLLDSVIAIEAQAARRKADIQSRANESASQRETPAGPPRLQKREDEQGPQKAPGDATGEATPATQSHPPGPGEEQVRGLLMSIDCSGTNILLIIKVGERLLKLQSAGLEDIEFITSSPTVNSDMTCGTHTPPNPVIVNYRPSKNTRAKIDGQALVVSFVSKEMLQEGKR